MQTSSRTLARALPVAVLAIFLLHSALPAAQRLTGGFMACYVAAQTIRAEAPVLDSVVFW
jgi:hypothetical protein